MISILVLILERDLVAEGTLAGGLLASHSLETHALVDVVDPWNFLMLASLIRCISCL